MKNIQLLNMNIKIPNPNVSKYKQSEFDKYYDSGIISQTYFENPEFWFMLNKLFRIEKNEEIYGISITDSGIRAKIGSK